MSSFLLVYLRFSFVILNTIHIGAINIGQRSLQQEYNHTTIQPIHQSTLNTISTSIIQTNYVSTTIGERSLDPLILILIAVLGLCVCCFFGLIVFYIPYSNKQTQRLKKFIDESVDTLKKQNISLHSTQSTVPVASLSPVTSYSKTQTKSFHHRKETIPQYNANYSIDNDIKCITPYTTSNSIISTGNVESVPSEPITCTDTVINVNTVNRSSIVNNQPDIDSETTSSSSSSSSDYYDQYDEDEIKEELQTNQIELDYKYLENQMIKNQGISVAIFPILSIIHSDESKNGKNACKKDDMSDDEYDLTLDTQPSENADQNNDGNVNIADIGCNK